VTTNKLEVPRNPEEKAQRTIAGVPPHLVGSIERAMVLPDKLSEVFRELILSGEWKPGAQLVETSVARQFRVAQPTVREALKQLEAEGLILRRPYRGCEIVSLTREEVDQIFRLRIEWEALAAELAVENRANWLPDQIAVAVENMAKAARKHDINAFYKHDLEFHRTFWSYTGNPYLARALSQITIPLFAFWTLRVVHDPEVDVEEQAKSHAKIVEAVLSGNKKQARKVTYDSMQEFWRDGARVASR
jgi:DNA-binding GntR family transcriptional regulator